MIKKNVQDDCNSLVPYEVHQLAFAVMVTQLEDMILYGLVQSPVSFVLPLRIL